ncbi:MAG TPA: TetR family transcriptional regulator [Candidatus Dormibacteraeota bacterium]
MSPTGLRERKKQKTKAAIQRAAMRLFKKQGYEETTVEQIAAAADISESTFFNYFPSKEDVVIYDEYDPMMFAALASAPPGETLRQTFERVIGELGDVFIADSEVMLERAKLSLEEPELRSRAWEEFDKARESFAGIIALRTGREARDFEVQLAAMTLIAAGFQAMVEWVRLNGKGSLLELLVKALDFVSYDEVLARLEPKRQV